MQEKMGDTLCFFLEDEEYFSTQEKEEGEIIALLLFMSAEKHHTR